jgi:hypothetical protein
MLLTITDVEYLGDYTLLCTFSTGERRKVDLTPLLSYPAYEELRDKKQFVQFGLDQTIFWKNGADIAPEWLYEKGQTA